MTQLRTEWFYEWSRIFCCETESWVLLLLGSVLWTETHADETSSVGFQVRLSAPGFTDRERHIPRSVSFPCISTNRERGACQGHRGFRKHLEGQTDPKRKFRNVPKAGCQEQAGLCTFPWKVTQSGGWRTCRCVCVCVVVFKVNNAIAKQFFTLPLSLEFTQGSTGL